MDPNSLANAASQVVKQMPFTGSNVVSAAGVARTVTVATGTGIMTAVYSALGK
jgi:hypothetical protein